MHEKVQVVSVVSGYNGDCPVSVGLLSECGSDQGTMDDSCRFSGFYGSFLLLDDEPE
jgi:hypothetical protein